MQSRTDVVKRIIWPARASLFALVGGAVGLFGDLVNFFADFISAGFLAALFAGVAVVAALLCFQRALMVNAADEKAVDEVVHCMPCDAFRFGLFATAVFVLLMLIGQGQSATETVGRQLGLIADDVTAIRSDVGELREMAEPQMIIDSPKTAAEHFNNAWLYQMMRRNPAKALESLREMYAEGAPRKMDAAQLYYDAGVTVMGRSQLVAEMQALARSKKDATLLVVAARGAESREAGDALVAEAKAMDPELPFSWWDMQRTVMPKASDTPAERLATMRRDKEAIDTFRRLYEKHPASHFFFMPQFQGDFGTIARQVSESHDQNIATYDDIVSGRLAARAREDARKMFEEAQQGR